MYWETFSTALEGYARYLANDERGETHLRFKVRITMCMIVDETRANQ